MPSRRVLRGIAGGIASGFSSRRNDVDGYWAPGVLYKLSKESGSNCFSLNLLTGESFPSLKWSEQAALFYRSFLLNQMAKNGVDSNKLKAANLKIEFNTTPNQRQIIFKYSKGDPFICIVELTDYLGKIWRGEFRGWCGPHDPTRECKSFSRYDL